MKMIRRNGIMLMIRYVKLIINDYEYDSRVEYVVEVMKYIHYMRLKHLFTHNVAS